MSNLSIPTTRSGVGLFPFSDQQVQLEEILDQIGEQIQLDETRWQRMEQSYRAVASWLEDDPVYFSNVKTDLYPHGSARIGTSTKPLTGNEYDLDLTVQVVDFSSTLSPMKLFNYLKRRLEESGRYKDKIELKNRCVRITFENDFHMDILPGRQQFSSDPNRIAVPDREQKDWVFSNPRGYSYWFIAKVNLAKDVVLERRGIRALKQEDLQRKVFMNKPLQRGVQLIKRYRDLWFENREYATSSIVLTTLFGMFYNGENSIVETIDAVLERINSHISAYPYTRLKVLNPVDSAEDFTDKWDNEPRYYVAFKEFVVNFYQEWQEIKAGKSIHQDGLSMRKLFGKTLYENALSRQAQGVGYLRESGQLGVNRGTGSLTAGTAVNATSVVKNTFFGSVPGKPGKSGSRFLTLPEQHARLRAAYPSLKYTLDAHHLTVKGQIRPTPRSRAYNFRLMYRRDNVPEVVIQEPDFQPGKSNQKVFHHVFPGNKLCLFRPKYGEFTADKSLAETVLPWISLWLYYHEISEEVGEWLGGGEHPNLAVQKGKTVG